MADEVAAKKVMVLQLDTNLTADDLAASFALFDADGDGKLTEDEVMAVLTRKTGMMTELSEEAARATWQRWKAEFDLNKDNKISYQELVRHLDDDLGADGLLGATGF